MIKKNKSKTKIKKNKSKKRIFFVRHAETFANLGQGYEHPAYIKLTEKGHADAKTLAKNIKKPGKIVVSRYFRTLQTAIPTIEKNEHIDAIVLPHIHEYTYLNPEKFNVAHLTNEQKNNYVKEYWSRMDPHYRDGGIAESFSDFLKRIKKSAKQINNIKSDGDIYVFTHGVFIKTFLLMHKIPEKSLKKFMQKFYDMQYIQKIEIENCQILDVTDLIEKYAK